MVVVPAATPVTVPVEFMVATAVLLLAQVPPEVASERAIVDPAHTELAPVIAAGNGLTVMVADLEHPVTGRV